jgi:hypothetical protein
MKCLECNSKIEVQDLTRTQADLDESLERAEAVLPPKFDVVMDAARNDPVFVELLRKQLLKRGICGTCGTDLLEGHR